MNWKMIILVMELIKQHDFLELRHTLRMGRGLYATEDIPPSTTLLDLGD